jgi:hypothetical protein
MWPVAKPNSTAYFMCQLVMLLSIRWKLAWIGYLYKVISGETDSDTVAVHRTNWLLKQKYEGAQNMVGESVDAFIKLPAQKFGKQ